MSSTELLRAARTWHKKVAAALFVFFFLISITGILLGWKNLFASKIYNTNAKQKTAKSMNEWLPLDSLKTIAISALQSKIPGSTEAKPESMNARLDKGNIRFTFSNQYNVQLNAQSGELQSIDKKAPEWITKLHDGELADDLFNLKNGVSKKVYTTTLGLALFFLTLSGFWMWFKPKQIKKQKEQTIDNFKN
jgi:uncharacterized iron-regulated membrane protein